MNNQIQKTDRRLLLQHILGITHEEYAREAPFNLQKEQEELLEQLLARRASGEPVAKIIGRKSFWKDEFITSTATLDPRPESEHIIEAVLKHVGSQYPKLSILDCGTGTGCLILSLLKEFPNATGYGIDISEQALAIARRNSTVLEMDNRVTFAKKSWTNLHEPIYDIIVSNPPYIRTSDMLSLAKDVIEYDPHESLDGGEDGLDAYKEIFSIINLILDNNGFFVCEAGYDQADDIVAIAENASMKHIDTIRDIDSIPRTLVFKHT